jgi:hypothetical protein
MRASVLRPPGQRHKLAGLAGLWAAAFMLLLTQAATPAAAPPDSSIVSRFFAQPDQPLIRYRALRTMHTRTEKFDHEAWLEAWTELDERGFRYEIVSESGSDYARNKVLRPLLKREQELIAGGHGERALLSAANYEFTDAAATGDGVQYVLLKPKRKDVLLVDGRMVLNQDATELLRVEGRLSKNPSFWTSSVNIIRHYVRLDGVRVPLSTESIAKIRFAGVSRLDVSYEYESINGRPVSVTARRMLASLR